MDLIYIRLPHIIPRRKTYLAIKRMIDLAICIFSLPLTVPIMVLSAIAIHLDDPCGPVFFIQERLGKGSRHFRMYKFRTMKTDIDDAQCRDYMKAYIQGEIGENECENQIYKPVPSQKIFRVGRILRKTSLDELPQIINVIKGEMSIVGPRPNVIWEVEAYRPWHHERMEVLPGITGLAQVKGRSSIGFNSLVRYDIAYIEQNSLPMDFKILWWNY